MEVLEIIVSGIIDGFTGFLPVSSSGHLALLRNIFGFGVAQSDFFDIFLKLAAIITIYFAFSKDCKNIIKATWDIIRLCIANVLIFFSNRGREKKGEYYQIAGSGYRKLTLMIMLSTLATGILGVFGRDFAKYAAGTVIIPAVCIILTGVVLFTTYGIPRGDVGINEATYFSAFVIGCVQGLSVLPGLARCGMVIACCMLFGYKSKLTMKFTFLVALPSLIGIVILDIIDCIGAGIPDVSNILFYLIAGCFSIVTGYVGIRIVNRLLKTGSFIYTAVYCLVIGAGAFAAVIVM